MSRRTVTSYWRRWVRQPQTVWLRKAIFHVHMWSGIAIGVYVFLVSVTGSILVFRNELYVAATREPVVVQAAGPRLSEEELGHAAMRAHPGYTVDRISRMRNANQAVSVSLTGPGGLKNRLF